LDSSVSLVFSLTGVPHSTDFSIRRNIKKPVLFPRYIGRLDGTEVPLAYVGSSEIEPGRNLSIIYMEDCIPENSRGIFSTREQFQGTSHATSAKYFLLTDVVGDFRSIWGSPFYWKHILPSPDIEPSSVAILDRNMEEVAEYSYRVVRTEEHDALDLPVDGSYEDCSVFSNYLNSYNEESGEYEAYYVRYQVDGGTHYQLLNSVPAFSEATFGDISSVTGMLKPWRKVYITSPGVSGYNLTLSQGGVDYYLRPLNDGRIAVRPPSSQSDNEPWFLNVSCGAFTAVRGGEAFSYSVPEFSSQSFSPIYPYKVEINEKAVRLHGDLLLLQRGSLAVDTSFFIMNILVKDASGRTLYALTTDAGKGGEFYYEGGERIYRTVETDEEWITWEADGIAGWDAQSGFIHLKRLYPDTYYFYASYYYREKGYELTALNVNPIFDEDFQDEFYVVYLVPTGGNNGNTGLQTRSLYYIKVDRSGKVVETNQDAAGGNYNLKSVILTDGESIDYTRSATTTAFGSHLAGGTELKVAKASLPLRLDDGMVNLPPRGVLLVGSGVNIVDPALGEESFPVGYTAFEDTDPTVTFTLGGVLPKAVPDGTTVQLYSFTSLLSALSSNGMQWLPLAEVYPRSSTAVEDLSIIDLRQIGGVIKDRYRAVALELDPRAVWAFPECIEARGQVIPGDTVAVFRLPFTLLEDYGGSFKESDIEGIVTTRHLGTGVVPTIIYDGAIPLISSLTSTTTTITVCWESEGESYHYNVYTSPNRGGPWTLMNSEPLDDQGYGNCYTIRDLPSGLIHYVSVTSISEDDIESPRGTSWGIKTRGA
jgi:hypothetical protein